MVAQPDPGFSSGGLYSGPTDTLAQSEHLLKVAASVNRDAMKAWAEIWGELKPHVTPGGLVDPALEKKGFVPACGWSEFLERLWLLKHYLDSIDRICRNKH